MAIRDAWEDTKNAGVTMVIAFPHNAPWFDCLNVCCSDLAVLRTEAQVMERDMRYENSTMALYVWMSIAIQ